ncbi:hypothetical protein [Xenorhabdus bovienii]|uniref:Morphogenetic protein n=1 Tax=Xenorhabdus bovienii TaxID=40576 RepID=A0A0B6XA42_XENBV|nr:hypothetical protein [Xenorhabdus bovienii]CDM90435.1 conserved protein of unknown function [Xenorhabdus bovienii]
MKETPIIFNADMVRAILDGRKTQTRRVIQSPAKNMQCQGSEVIRHRALGDKWYGDYVFSMRDKHGTWQDYTHKQFIAKCPRGQIGDRLWVRETFAVLGNEDGCPIDWDENLIKGDEQQAARIYKASCWQNPSNYGLWSIPDRDMQYEGTWRPSIHMPRWASRITLEVTDIRVERLQDIKEEDALAEGIKTGRFGNKSNWRDGFYAPGDNQPCFSAKEAFKCLWQSIYSEESWNANPWVWVIEFRRVNNDK